MIDTSSQTTTGAWKLEQEDDGVAWLIFDLPEEKVNKLTRDVLEDLDRVLAGLEGESGLEALIVCGGKEESGTFIAGADIHEIASVTSASDATVLARRGQEVLGRFATLPAVTVAAIHGNCLGGGTELALACDLRVASDSPRTKIGLPEVQLGILPGFGGTQRLPRLVGLSRALPVILGGRPLDVRRAGKIGLVDRVVYPTLLRRSARELALEAVRRGGKSFRPKRPPEPFLPRLLSKTSLGRSYIRSRARKDIVARVGRHYPAPFKALDAAVDGFGMSLREGLELEASLVGELVASPISKNLIRLFLTSEEARRGSRSVARPQAASAAPPVRAASVRRVAVLGAGVMGGGIAALLARKSYRVRLKDIQPEAIQSALAKVDELFSARVRRRRMTPRETQNCMGLISTTTEYTGFESMDVVIEAVVEDMDIKKIVLREVEEKITEQSVFASNTSALSITELQSAARHPARVVGLHFFNPVDRMPLVEIIRGEHTSDEAVEAASALARDLGKVPVLVADGPGFLVNRLLAPYLNEAARLFQEGYDPSRVDAVARDFGMPMGPFELLDEVGLDVARKVAVFLHGALGERFRPVEVMEKLYEAGILGKKKRKGFYVYDGKKKTANPAALRLGGTGGSDFKADEEGVWRERLIYPIINEAAFALDDRIVTRPSRVDLAMVMGTGFAPFRGGPLRYADSLGAKKVVGSIRERGLCAGQVAGLLERLATEGSRFYDLEAAASDLPPSPPQGDAIGAR